MRPGLLRKQQIQWGSNGVFRGDSDRENGLENDHENDLEAQHLDEDGVPEDMATLVLDNSALGVGRRKGRARLAGILNLTDQRCGHHASGGGGG